MVKQKFILKTSIESMIFLCSVYIGLADIETIL